MTLFRMYYATDRGRAKSRLSLQVGCTYNQSMLLKKRHGRGDEGHREALMGSLMVSESRAENMDRDSGVSGQGCYHFVNTLRLIFISPFGKADREGCLPRIPSGEEQQK